MKLPFDFFFGHAGSEKNVGGGGALGIGYGQPGYFGERGGVGYQNAYGGNEPRYDGGYGRGYEPRYGGRRSGYHRYGGRQGSGFGRNGDQVGRYNGGYNCSVGYRAGRN